MMNSFNLDAYLSNFRAWKIIGPDKFAELIVGKELSGGPLIVGGRQVFIITPFPLIGIIGFEPYILGFTLISEVKSIRITPSIEPLGIDATRTCRVPLSVYT